MLVVYGDFKTKEMGIVKYTSMSEPPEVRLVRPKNLACPDLMGRYKVVRGPLVLEVDKMFLWPPFVISNDSYDSNKYTQMLLR